MSRCEELLALLERVRAATGPDRELDAQILCRLLAPPKAFVEQSSINGAWCIYEPRSYGDGSRLWITPAPWREDHASVTDSIDAALALVERVLPGWRRLIEEKADHWWAGLHAPEDDPRNPGSYFRARGATAPLAVVAVLLHTLIEREAAHGE